MINKYAVNDREKAKICAKFFAESVKDLTPNPDKKKLTIVFGQPGTGKTTYAKKIQDNSIVISPDNFHALYPKLMDGFDMQSLKFTKEEKFNEALDEFVDSSFTGIMAESLTRGYDTILELQPSKNVLFYAEAAKEMGYDVDIKLMCSSHSNINTQVAQRTQANTTKLKEKLSRGEALEGADVVHLFSPAKPSIKFMKETQEVLSLISEDGFPLEIINPAENKVLYDSKKDQSNPAMVYAKEANKELIYRQQKLQEEKAS